MVVCLVQRTCDIATFGLLGKKELQNFACRADATTAWNEYTTDEGRKYYHNRVTKKSQWTIPEELKIARELAEKASSQRPDQDAQTTAGAYVGSSYAASSTHDAVAVVSERIDQELRI
uniref:WW domain-containing protein n=1 Tax=Aegilops tauschii subsp. strangulata TaxID=200361 RepID=A0A453HET8_AEGTS